MIEFENTIHIRRDITTVYDFVTEPANIPLWNYFVRSVEQIGPDRYHQVRDTDEQTYRVLERDPNRRIVLETEPGEKPAFYRAMTFTEANGGTHIHDVWKLDLGMPGFVETVAKGPVRAAIGKNLDKLKELMETGKTTLQNGRKVRL